MEENYDVQAEGTANLSFMRFHDHILLCFQKHWLTFLLTFITVFGISWTVVESLSYLLQLNLSSLYILIGCILISILIGVIKTASSYRNAIPGGLEKESKSIHNVVIGKKPFWEFKLASLLLHDRLDQIDKKLENLLSGKVHIKVEKSFSIEEYSNWLTLRPHNLLDIVAVAKKLLIFELSICIGGQKTGKFEIQELINVVNQIRDLYEEAYEFEIESYKVNIPDEFKKIHEIQTGWVSVIRDSFRQMLNNIDIISNRSFKDKTPVNASIIFEEPPRYIEFEKELERLENELFN